MDTYLSNPLLQCGNPSGSFSHTRIPKGASNCSVCSARLMPRIILFRQSKSPISIDARVLLQLGTFLYLWVTLLVPTITLAEETSSYTHSSTPAGHAGGGHSAGAHGEQGGHGTPPETFAILDLFAEALEATFGGVWIKLTELRPKVEHIRELYRTGQRGQAFAKGLGVATEVVLIGFFMQAFGIGEMFIAGVSFSDGWFAQFAQSIIGVGISVKAAVIAAEYVEEAVEEKHHHELDASSANSLFPHVLLFIPVYFNVFLHH
jgi:hypothetical protein